MQTKRYFATVGLMALTLGLLVGHSAASQSNPSIQLAATTKAPILNKSQLLEIDAFINQVLTDWQVPGAAIAIVQGETVLYSKGYGLRDLKKKLPFTPQTLFPIASISKSITALSLLMLEAEGKVSLQRPIKIQDPAFGLSTAELTQQCTIEDLLTHRTGLPSHDVVWFGSSATRADLVKQMAFLPTNRPFRESWQYSNLSYTMTGAVLEHLTGQSWESYVQQKLLTPLGMKNTNFSVTASQKSTNYALPYRWENDAFVEGSFVNLDAMAPCGGVNSTLEDMSRYLIMQLNQGRYQEREIVPPALIRRSHDPLIVMPPHRTRQGLPMNYGLGWWSYVDHGYRLVEHGGEINGFNSMMTLVPEKNIGVILFTMSSNLKPTALVKDFVLSHAFALPRDTTYATQVKTHQYRLKNYKESSPLSDPARRLNTTPTHSLAEYQGIYSHPGYGPVKISTKEQQLLLQYNGLETPLLHFHYNSFVTQNRVPYFKQGVQFLTDFDGAIDQVLIRFEPKVPPIAFVRQKANDSKM